MYVAWVPGSDTDSLLAKQLYKDRVALPLDTTVVDDPFLTWVKDLILRVKNSTTIAKPIGDLHLISHGDDSGPNKLRFSAEDAYQRSHGHGTAVWLSAF